MQSTLLCESLCENFFQGVIILILSINSTQMKNGWGIATIEATETAASVKILSSPGLSSGIPAKFCCTGIPLNIIGWYFRWNQASCCSTPCTSSTTTKIWSAAVCTIPLETLRYSYRATSFSNRTVAYVYSRIFIIWILIAERFWL